MIQQGIVHVVGHILHILFGVTIVDVAVEYFVMIVHNILLKFHLNGVQLIIQVRIIYLGHRI